MPDTSWIKDLTVAKLKDELKKRGQPVSGKKAELVERLEAYIIEHDGSPEEVAAAKAAAAGDEGAAAGAEDEDAIAEAEEDAVAEPEVVGEEQRPAVMEEEQPAEQAASEQAAEQQQGQQQHEAMDVDVTAPPQQQQQQAAAAPKQQQRRQGGGGGGNQPRKVGAPRPGRGGGALTLADISGDKLTQLAEATWSAAALTGGKTPTFDPDLVEQIYASELGGESDKAASSRRIQLLEISQYLENYLWPGYGPRASYAHVMSILVMINEKFKEGLPAWTVLAADKDKFGAFWVQFLGLKAQLAEDGGEMRAHERVAYLQFAINAFQSLENETVRACVLRLVSLPLWHALSRGRLQLELHDQPGLAKHWKHLAKREAKAAAAAGEAHVPVTARPEATFVPGLIDEFLGTLAGAVAEAGAGGEAPPPPRQALLYCERFLEFLVDLLSQLPTRRFVHALLEDRAVLVKCYMSPLYKHSSGQLFVQLTDLLRFYMSFPIHDHTGDPLSEEDVTAAHYERLQQLQRLFFRYWPKLQELALANCGTVEKREVLRKELAQLLPDELHFLVTRQLRLVGEDDRWAGDPAFLLEVMLATYERRKPQAEVINEMPLYPTEAVLFDENQVPTVNYTGDSVLALPKLNLQFLTFHDYLMRNFNLFRLEATYEIREDIVDVLQRVGPYLTENDEVNFSGWARMAHTIDKYAIVEVRKPKVGESKPAAVTADITINTKSMRPDVRAEWDELRQHDVLFLLTLRPPDAVTAGYLRGARQAAAAQNGQGQAEPNPMEQYGLQYVRGCEVIEIRDEDGKLMNDFTGRVRPDEQGPPKGFLRTITVAMDTAQYQLDMNYMAKHSGAEDVYASFNLLMRRKAKENNFKAVLESIRDLMNEEYAVPPWLHDILLGYGDPGAAQYQHMSDQLTTIDFKDTFLDPDHVRECFPDYKVEFVNKSRSGTLQRPFRITFPPPPQPADAGEGGEASSKKKKRKAGAEEVAAGEGGGSEAAAEPPTLLVESYTPTDPGPYPQDQPPQNQVRFTPVQTQAIMSGVQPGLTMVVGPPGTGKTDTAVQIMHILYHNCPNQRTLVVTHSNQALNDLFAKISERDVPSRYLLRLGMGEAELETDLDFSRVGRVNAMLARRLELLAEVERMAKLLDVPESVAYTCENAQYFWLLHVLSRWEKFTAQVAKEATPEAVAELFPFKSFFADAPHPLFVGRSYEEDMERARGCFRHLRNIFQELEEVRPFELLKTQGDRVSYLLTKQAKIVAMTCTHAALKRKEFMELGFKYDNLLMEESAQILEIETFIPMLLQQAQDGHNRLKRVILIGDHHQLPPVVKNQAIQKYSHLDQSLFTRFIRLGTPYIELNAQGRARPSLARLYNWRYRDLGDLPNVRTQPAFQLANAGFAFDFQLIDVPDYQGRGESCPLPYFFQNLGEAEYLVSVYQYMRLLGYPANRISVLTTYNGQKALLRDVFERRCARHPAFGRPAIVTTVDKFQGNQNDFILLSLVRTNHFGHLRDVRRLVVAMSRARLGLYIFGRAGLFANCFELQPTFRQLLARPTKLALVPGERHGACVRLVDAVPPAMVVEGTEHMARVVVSMAKEWEQAAVAASRQWGYGVAGDADAAVADGGEATPGEEAAPGGEQQQQEEQQPDSVAAAEQQLAADGQLAADKQLEEDEQPGEQQVAVADGAKPMQE